MPRTFPHNRVTQPQVLKVPRLRNWRVNSIPPKVLQTDLLLPPSHFVFWNQCLGSMKIALNQNQMCLIHTCLHMFNAAEKCFESYCKTLWSDQRTLEVSTPNIMLHTAYRCRAGKRMLHVSIDAWLFWPSFCLITDAKCGDRNLHSESKKKHHTATL